VVSAQSRKLPVVQIPSFKKDSFNILKYGAKPDGISPNTQYINAFISACNKNGVVMIPGEILF